MAAHLQIARCPLELRAKALHIKLREERLARQLTLPVSAPVLCSSDNRGGKLLRRDSTTTGISARLFPYLLISSFHSTPVI